MANVDWSFGPGGCEIKVTARDGTQSVVESDMPVANVTMSFNGTLGSNHAVGWQPVHHAPPPVQTMQLLSQSTAVTILPVQVDAFINFEDEGTICAQWTVSSAGIRGKGCSKSLGKGVAVVNPGI